MIYVAAHLRIVQVELRKQNSKEHRKDFMGGAADDGIVLAGLSPSGD